MWEIIYCVMVACECELIVKSPTINIGQCADRFEETGIGNFSRKPLRSGLYVSWKRFRSRRWSSEVQGLVATNPEDISKMDVVGVVPSVPFGPGTDLYG